MGAGISQALQGVGNKLNASELQNIANKLGVSVTRVAEKASSMGISMGAATQRIVAEAAAPPPPPPSPSPSPSPSPPSPPPSTTTTTTTNTWSGPTETQIPYSEYSLFGDTISTQVQNQGLEAVERIRQAGATERLKYEVDNRIPEIQAEAKGKLDLQAIVNAGYKNIANIERGSDMVRHITSMFNF